MQIYGTFHLYVTPTPDPNICHERSWHDDATPSLSTLTIVLILVFQL